MRTKQTENIAPSSIAGILENNGQVKVSRVKEAHMLPRAKAGLNNELSGANPKFELIGLGDPHRIFFTKTNMSKMTVRMG